MADVTTELPDGLTAVRDLPPFEKRAPGVSDLDHVRAQWARGPLARDSVGIVHAFPQSALFAILDDDVTRQIETETLMARGIRAAPAWEFFGHSLLTSNGAPHKRRRGALARTFAFPLMRALRPQVRQAVDDLLAEAGHGAGIGLKAVAGQWAGAGQGTGADPGTEAGQGAGVDPGPDAGQETGAGQGTGPGTGAQSEIDILDALAGPLPARVIARVLGVPADEAPHFAGLVYSAIRVLQNRNPEVIDAAVADLGRLNAYVGDLMARRRAAPQQDFLSRFVRDAADRLDETEIRVQLVTVIFGGSDTTRAQLTMALARLLEHPEQWALLKADPESWAGPAVEEALRYDPVVGGLGRVAIRDFALEGARIPRGTILSPNLVAALRDPAVYAEPDRFDITRTDHPRHTPAFGAGPHRCLGEALARVELEEALKGVAAAWPDMVMTGAPPRLRGLSGTRGISPLTIRPRP